MTLLDAVGIGIAVVIGILLLMALGYLFIRLDEEMQKEKIAKPDPEQDILPDGIGWFEMRRITARCLAYDQKRLARMPKERMIYHAKKKTRY